MSNGLTALEQIAGGALMLFVLLDVFSTVLYARIGTGILSARLARASWFGLLCVGEQMPSRRGWLLSFCGPLSLVLLVLAWGFALTLGSALMLHPDLGTTLLASSGKTQTDFVTAMFAGGSSISVVGAGNYVPQSARLKMFFLFNSLAGMSVLSLTLTYLMQIYTALQKRNSVALGLDLSSGRKADAAQFLSGIGPQGHFETGYSTLATLAEEIADIKEAHHFYPVLFYFRFEEPLYSVSRLTNVALDAVTLIRTALDPGHYGWLAESGAVAEIWDGSLLLLTTLENNFVPAGLPDLQSPDSPTRDLWRRRFFNAVSVLQAANIAIVHDLEGAARSYVALRSKWSGHVNNLAPFMMYSMEDVDPPVAVHFSASDQACPAA